MTLKGTPRLTSGRTRVRWAPSRFTLSTLQHNGAIRALNGTARLMRNSIQTRFPYGIPSRVKVQLLSE